MHYSIHHEDGQWFVWSEVEPQIYMMVAAFLLKADAEFYVESRNKPIELKSEDLVADSIHSAVHQYVDVGLEEQINQYLRECP